MKLSRPLLSGLANPVVHRPRTRCASLVSSGYARRAGWTRHIGWIGCVGCVGFLGLTGRVGVSQAGTYAFDEADVEVLFFQNGEVAGDQFGYVCQPIPDLNSDGVEEILTSAPYHDAGGNNAGKVYLLDGATGATLREHIGTVVGGFLGWRLGSAGDINGDLIPDYTVSASGDQNTVQDGEVFVFDGDLGVAVADAVLLHFVAETPGDRFGHDSGGLKDITGDGVPEIICGGPQNDINGTNSGRVYIYSGADGSLVRTHDGEAAGYRLGSGARDIGDVDGDEVHDYVVTAPGGGPSARGQAYVFSGADGSLVYELFPTSPTAREFGRYFANTPGDMTGDGVNDLFISDFWDNAAGIFTGKVYAFDGATGELLYTVDGDSQWDYTGFGGRIAGDLNNDGFADFWTGFNHNPEIIEAPYGGRIRCISGVDGTVIREVTSLYGDSAGTVGEWLGYDVTGISDVDGDGVRDIVATAGFNYENGPQSGRLYVIRGKELDAAHVEPVGSRGDGTNLNTFESIEILPNPFRDVVDVRFRSGGSAATATLHAPDGSLVWKGAMSRIAGNEQVATIRLGEDLPTGTFFIRIEDGTQIRGRKILRLK